MVFPKLINAYTYLVFPKGNLGNNAQSLWTYLWPLTIEYKSNTSMAAHVCKECDYKQSPRDLIKNTFSALRVSMMINLFHPSRGDTK